LGTGKEVNSLEEMQKKKLAYNAMKIYVDFMTPQEAHKLIEDNIKQNEIVLFMKGYAEAPVCGFSGKVVQILNRCGVNFQSVNVLENPTLRQAIKDFSNWPTIPQLYVKGEFIGGCDIVTEMAQTGELQSLLKEKNINCNAH
jgi:monothiol glutaredoxin